jgi:hypothetical protein
MLRRLLNIGSIFCLVLSMALMGNSKVIGAVYELHAGKEDILS